MDVTKMKAGMPVKYEGRKGWVVGFRDDHSNMSPNLFPTAETELVAIVTEKDGFWWVYPVELENGGYRGYTMTGCVPAGSPVFDRDGDVGFLIGGNLSDGYAVIQGKDGVKNFPNATGSFTRCHDTVEIQGGRVYTQNRPLTPKSEAESEAEVNFRLGDVVKLAKPSEMGGDFVSKGAVGIVVGFGGFLNTGRKDIWQSIGVAWNNGSFVWVERDCLKKLKRSKWDIFGGKLETSG